jgi:geranylgeranyl diphosphate synthase, type II
MVSPQQRRSIMVHNSSRETVGNANYPVPKSASSHTVNSTRFCSVKTKDGTTVGYADPMIADVNRTLEEMLHNVPGCPSTLHEAMAYSLLASGKRLRPRLVMLACAAAGGGEEAALPAAAAVEMVHTYSLIHDDLPAMDDDDLRRGRPTCHKKFGEAMAILAGDALLTLSFHTLATHYPAKTAAGCVVELSKGAGAGGMVGGQVLDLAWENRQDGGNVELEAVHAAKTGALYRACLRIGCWVAQGERPGGPDVKVMAALEEYGRAFGLMFQITDDLLDVEGDASAAGKRVGKDAGRGKLTYPGLLGVDESRRLAQQLCQQAESAIAPIGWTAERLADLARSVCNRDR